MLGRGTGLEEHENEGTCGVPPAQVEHTRHSDPRLECETSCINLFFPVPLPVMLA